MAIRRAIVFIALVLVLLTSTTAHADGNVTWSPTTGPEGGLVNALAIATNVPGVIYAGTNGGVYLTRDDGVRWQLVSKGLPDDPTITALAVTLDPNTALAGTHHGIYRTWDTGNNWAITDPRFAEQFILSLLVDPLNPHIVYAGTTTTVLRSDDYGETWRDVGADLHTVRVTALALSTDSTTLFAATDAGIYTSRDRGARWQLSSEGLADGARPQAIVATTRGFLAGTSQGMYRSRDGKTWTLVGAPFTNLVVRPIVNDARQPDRVIAVTPQNILKSDDGGTTWKPLPFPSGAVSILTLTLGERNGIYIGSARGIWKTMDDGTAWNQLTGGLISTSVHSMLLLPGTPSTLLAATRYGIYYSRDQGASWKDSRGPSDPYVLSLAFDAANPRTVYAGTWGSAIFTSSDSGASFTNLVGNLANNAPISSLAVLHPTANSTDLYAGTLGNGLYKSNDGGQKWTPQTAGLANINRVTMLAFIPPSTLYAGTERGLYQLDTSVSSATWLAVPGNLPQEEARSIAFDPPRSKNIWVGFASTALYRSEDGGTTWSHSNPGAFPPRVRLQAMSLSPNIPNLLYIGTDRGVYRSEDGGTSFAVANDGLAILDVQALVIDPAKPDKIFAATNGNGILVGTDQYKVTWSPWFTIGMTAIAFLGVWGILALGLRIRRLATDQERQWALHWQQWETMIQESLWRESQAAERDLPRIPRKMVPRALAHYAKKHSDVALTLDESSMVLKFEHHAMALKFLDLWKAAWQVVENEEAFRSVSGQIVDQLCALLGFTRVEERTYQGMIGYVVKASALRLKIPLHFPVVFIPRRQGNDQDLSKLRDLMGVLNMVGYFALVIDLADTQPSDPRKSLKRILRQAIHDFIVLDGTDMRRILAARDHERALVETILSQVDLTVISPYVTSGPVPANMFFGREHELKTIMRTIRDTNYAIIGGRKIGKTSVLARIHQYLQETPDFKPIYLDCQAIHTYPEFFQAIETMWKMTLSTHTLEGLRRLMSELPAQNPGRTIVLLFDEIDALLQHDIAQGEPMFRMLRALSQEGNLHFVFCGEKVLSGSLHDPGLVFFNFCNFMPLTYLKHEEAVRVVVEPMEEMGIALEEGRKLADEIVELAAGHPNIVQYICQQLIERINQRRERRILRADLEAVSQSAQFAEYFSEVSWGYANALERLITLLMLDHPEVTWGEMSDALHKRGVTVTPDAIETAFDDLCLYSIVRKDGPKFTFAARKFPDVLRRSQDVGGLVPSFIDEVRKSQKQS